MRKDTIYYTEPQIKESDGVDGMDEKIFSTKFTIQLSPNDPSHFRAAEIISNQGRRGKAQYIVNAVLHFENCRTAPNINRPAEIDEKLIETVVYRILKENSIIPGPCNKTPAENTNDDVIDSLGEEELNSIAGALDMFKKT